jgi:hypothetical protein
MIKNVYKIPCRHSYTQLTVQHQSSVTDSINAYELELTFGLSRFGKWIIFWSKIK